MKSEVDAAELDRAVESAMTEGRLEGKAEGRLEGKAEGRLEGKAEGRLEGMAAMLRALGVTSVESFQARVGREPDATQIEAIALIAAAPDTEGT